MYIPEHFRVNDEHVLRQFAAANSFGMLITHGQDLLASHLPLLLEGSNLVGHVARGNPQAKDIEAGLPALAIFHGPHAYVSPSWYADPQTAVPTWNYTAVHVYGKPRVITDPNSVKQLLERLVSKYESARESPWGFDLDAQHIDNLIRGIVAFEMPIDRMEGKFKLSQNRPIGDRGRVMWSLKSSESQMDQQVAAMMSDLF